MQLSLHIPCPLNKLKCLNINVQILITTYKTRFDSGGVLNECELDWEKETKEDGRSEANKEQTKRFQHKYLRGEKKNSKKKMPVGRFRDTRKEFLNLFE